MHKKILFISIAWLCAITGMAQNLEIKQDFKISENSSAAIMYHNQFGQYEKPALDDTFPYAVVRVLLEGNAQVFICICMILARHNCKTSSHYKH